jgi:hypothetical protein
MEEKSKRILIRKPDDSGDYYITEISCNKALLLGSRDYTIHLDRSHKDPIHGALVKFWTGAFGKRNRHSTVVIGLSERPKVVSIAGVPFAVSRVSNRYHFNGQPLKLSAIADIFARVTYKSCFENDKQKLMAYAYSLLNMPENVRYAIENRVPYWFYENYQKIEVRLNVMQIADDVCAIEIADGVWGEISFKNLDTFCNFYVHGNERGSWKYLSPEALYNRLIGPARESDLKMMVEFLKQNRQQDIVESRARQLLDELVEKYPERIFLREGEDQSITMYIRGKHYDWKLTDNKYKSDIQQVSTFVYQPSRVNSEDNEPKWQGPICIDNMARGSSLGDQFATRALAFLNDFAVLKAVSTINNYIVSKPNENRIDLNAL